MRIPVVIGLCLTLAFPAIAAPPEATRGGAGSDSVPEMMVLGGQVMIVAGCIVGLGSAPLLGSGVAFAMAGGAVWFLGQRWLDALSAGAASPAIAASDEPAVNPSAAAIGRLSRLLGRGAPAQDCGNR